MITLGCRQDRYSARYTQERKEMAARHLIVTDVFDGEGSWKQWIRHLGNAAAVNNWDDEAILKWLKVRLKQGRLKLPLKDLRLRSKQSTDL